MTREIFLNKNEGIPKNFPIDMYNFPGQDINITKYWYTKYQKANSKLDYKQIIKQGLQNKDWHTKMQAIKLGSDIDDPEVKEEIKEVIKMELENKDFTKKIEAIKLGSGIDDTEVKEEIKEAIKIGLEDEGWHTKMQAIELGSDIDDPEVKEEIKEVIKNHFNKHSLTAEKVLYGNSLEEDTRFGKRLKKDGSETILLNQIPGIKDKTFKQKIILRKIDIFSFLAWKKAFEDHQTWKENGFDYVPVEPILYFTIDGDTANVYTAVLDNNITELQINPQQDFEKILSKIGIEHGHIRNRNICTLFPRNRKGEIIIDGTMPRQYIIDFDQAYKKI